MKKEFKVIKQRLYSKIDYQELINTKKYNSFNLTLKRLDPISISSGILCVFDAYEYSGTKPFLEKFPCGECTPYYLTVPTSEGIRIAYAGLKFSVAEAAEWTLALFEDKDVLKLIQETDSVFSVINSGIFCFGDYLKMREYDNLVKNKIEDFHPLDSAISFDGSIATLFNINNEPSLAVFSSGWGDGNYSCYIGKTESGEITNLICDFNMIDYEPVKEDKNKTVSYIFDINIEQLYQNDPRMTDEENNIAKWSMVLENADKDDNYLLYKAYSRRGNAYHNMTKYDLALEDYYKALSLAESNTEKHNNFKIHEWSLYDNAGIINMKQGNLEEAKRLFEKAKLAGDNFYSGSYVNLIEIHMLEKNYEKAREICDEMILNRSQDPNSYKNSAEINVASENYEAAIKDYDILIDKFQWDEGILEKSACLSMLGKYTEAMKALEEYVVLNKGNELYYYNKGFIEFKQNKYIESFESLFRAYECNPEYLPTLHLLIEMDELMFNNNRIIKWSSNYIALRPSNEFGYNVRAEAYLKTRNYINAQKDYQYIIDNISKDSIYFRGLAVAYSLNRDYTKCKTLIKKLKKTNDAAYRNALGILYLHKKKYEKSEKLLLEVFNAGKTDEYYSDLINCYINSKNFEKAEKLIDEFALFSPSSDRLIFCKIGLCKANKGSSMYFSSLVNEYISKFLPQLSDVDIILEIADKLKTEVLF